MRQVLQWMNDGRTELVDVPVPVVGSTSNLVESHVSVVSAGTERMLVDFGRANLMDKARQQPDKIKQVLDKVRTDGLQPTLEAVRAKLQQPLPLGYCEAGIVAATGSKVQKFKDGDRVVTNGPHAEYVRVSHNLAARIPDNVSFEAAAFTPLAAIGLQGLRLAQPTLGETVVVYGLGLIGLLTVQLARANGCHVIGIDRSPSRLALARQFGAQTVAADEGVDVSDAVLELTGGQGADAVLLTLAASGDEPMHAAATMSRQRGRLVLVGVTGLNLRRDDFYKKELSFQVACSFGPGRYDPNHEDAGIDYPLPFVRWTEARNFDAVLGLMASGAVNPLPLITHRFAIADAVNAYDVVAGSEPSLGIVLTYSPNGKVPSESGRAVDLVSRAAPAGKGVVGFIGAGNFASRMLIPAFAKGGASLETLASSGGVSAAVVGRKLGFRRATTDAASLLSDPALDTIVVTTRHDSHADWTVRALSAGKHVFVEKPLALTDDELGRVREALDGATHLLCVGYNRRYAPLIRKAHEASRGRTGPAAIVITVNAGFIPPDHWTQNRAIGGGRIIGEGTHFIDLARFLAGSPIASVQVTSAGGVAAGADDVAMIQLGFADGSIASIQYLANGNPGFPKERIEMFFDGKTLRVDNYRSMHAWGISGLNTRWPQSQDKGHAALVAAFLEAVRTGGPSPIPREELLEVTEWSIRAAALAARGEGSA